MSKIQKKIIYGGNFEELVEKLELDDRVVGLTYEEICQLVPLMEKKFKKKLWYSCYGEPLTIFFTD